LSSAVLMSLYECGVDYVQGYIVGMPRLHLSLVMSLMQVQETPSLPAAVG